MTRPDRACALALGRVERNAAQRSAAQLSPVPQAGQEFPSLSRVFILHSFISISSVRVAAISQLLFNKKNSSYIILQ